MSRTPDVDLRWFKPHLLHLRIEYGGLYWRIECPGADACDCPTCDQNGDPQEPRECWLAEQMSMFVDDWTTEEIIEDLSMDPVRSPLLVEFALPGLGPESGPDESGPDEVRVRLAEADR